MAMKLAIVLLLVCALVAAPIHVSAISCSQVAGSLSPCISYLRSTGGAIPDECCSGIVSLNNAAKSTPDRQTACDCIKSTAATISGLNYDLAAGLPAKCGVTIPYKISPSTDCKSVK